MSNNDNVKIEKDLDKISTNSADNSEQEDSGNNSDENDIPHNKNSKKRITEKKDVASLQFGKKIEESLLYYKL